MKVFSITLIITFILFIGLFSNCSKNLKCSGDNQENGIIANSLKISCTPMTGLKTLIIEDDSTFKTYFSNITTGQLLCTLPEIDFDAFTLLGQYTTGGCEVIYIREVSKHDDIMKYHYKVTVKECGSCMKESYSFNWVTVPKLPDGWNVTFEQMKE